MVAVFETAIGALLVPIFDQFLPGAQRSKTLFDLHSLIPRDDWFRAWVVIASLVVFTILVSSKTEFYMILFFPGLILMVAAALSDVADRLEGARLLASAFLVLMAVGVMGFEDNFRDVVQAASDFEDRDYGSLTAQIQAAVPAGVLRCSFFNSSRSASPFTSGPWRVQMSASAYMAMAALTCTTLGVLP